ncbi:MAG: shikimate kinase [Terriglobales bacterium]
MWTSKETTAKKARGIYLVGFSGSGKSTIAKLIGERLRWPACDLDDLIVERSGTAIPALFEREGEAGFRRRETAALRAASDQDRFVVATGGGTIVQPENQNFMASKGWIICLEAQPQTLLARIQQQLKTSDPRAIRPLLDAGNPLEQIRSLKQTRQSAYRLADWTVQTDLLSAEQVADEVVRAIEVLEHADEAGSRRK